MGLNLRPPAFIPGGSTTRPNRGELTIQVQLWVLHAGGEIDAPLLLAPEGHSRRLLVQPNAKPLQLMLNQLLVGDGLQAVQHNQNQVARPCCTDDLQVTITRRC